MASYTAATICIFAIAGTLVILNSFILAFALQIRPRTRDIIFIVTICCIEYLTPLIGWANIVYFYITGIKALNQVVGCQILGFLSVTVFYYEVILNLILAIERLSHITKQPYLKKLYIPIAIMALSFFALLVTSASQHLLIASASNAICLMSPTYSLTTAITYFHFLISMFISSIAIFVCYVKIAFITNQAKKFIKINIETITDSSNISQVSQNLKWATIRLFSILAVYIICTLGSIILFSVETYFEFKYGFGTPIQKTLNSTAIFLFLSGSVTNSLILLFLHTGIAKQRQIFVDKVSRFLCCK
ncbi:hypothetical protein K502DRAFT_362645 [Neoconidiobolus thromboides FSU 785]|nr:hypothetical protein K502DRAFT_362645 [Neoconidiobolus thromboides FSU 785]